jgi:integrase
MPEFPEAKFELGFRSTIDKGTQEAILEEVHRISYHINPKIWLGIKWLCTYISIRPGELVKIKEKHLDLENGYIIIPHPKEKRPKLVPLLAEDMDLIRSLPRGLPELRFFRHVKGIKGCRAGERFGEKYFYKWWVKACKNLGIEGVDLYGGTRHSSAIALRQYRTPEEIRRATMHSTNKAFERYFRIESEDLRSIYRDALSKSRKDRKVLKFMTHSEQG